MFYVALVWWLAVWSEAQVQIAAQQIVLSPEPETSASWSGLCERF